MLLGCEREIRIRLLIYHGKFAFEVESEATRQTRRSYEDHLSGWAETRVQISRCRRKREIWSQPSHAADHTKTSGNHPDGDSKDRDFFTIPPQQVNCDEDAENQGDSGRRNERSELQPRARRYISQGELCRPTKVGFAPGRLIFRKEL